jgi:hypothetical protein
MTVPKDGAVVIPHGSTVVSHEDVNVDVAVMKCDQLEPDLCTEFGLEGDCLLNFGHPRFCRIGFMTSTESLPL